MPRTLGKFLIPWMHIFVVLSARVEEFSFFLRLFVLATVRAFSWINRMVMLAIELIKKFNVLI